MTVDSAPASILALDISDIELYVTKNNPQTINSLIRRLKAFYKNNPDVDLYKTAYSLMPSQATSFPDTKQLYINGHFWMITLKRHIQNSLFKRNPIPQRKTNPLEIPLP